MPLTVLAIADQVDPLLYEHFDRARWAHIDLIVSCGDLPPDYLDFLCSSLDVPLLYVRGNHDGIYKASQYAGSDNMHGRIAEYKGIRVVGFEGSQRYNQGAYQYTEREMRRIVWKARLKALRTGKPDLVITHAPPAGIHDAEDLCHRGFEAFTAALQVWQPAIWVHGHMHAYERTEEVTMEGTTQVMTVFPRRVFQIS